MSSKVITTLQDKWTNKYCELFMCFLTLDNPWSPLTFTGEAHHELTPCILVSKGKKIIRVCNVANVRQNFYFWVNNITNINIF